MSQSNNARKRRKQSWLWEYYVKVDWDTDEARVVCQRPGCQHSIPKDKAKHRQMSYHLLSQHNIKPPNPPKRKKDDGKELLFKAFISGYIPFTFVENEAFREFLNHQCPGFKPPTRQWISDKIVDKTNEVVAKLKGILQGIKHLSLTIDCWTAKHNSGHLFGVTCHYITSDWKLESHIFLPKQVTCITQETIRTSTEALIKEIPMMMQDYGIAGKVSSITTDKGSDIRSCMTRLGLKSVWYPCWNHVLNRAFVVSFDHAAQSERSQAFDKMKALSKFLRKSWRAAELIANEEQVSAMKSFSTTRWTYIIPMMHQYLSVKNSLASILRKLDEEAKILTDQENEIILEVYQVLKILHPIISAMQSEHEPKLSMGVESFYFIMTKLRQSIPQMTHSDSKRIIRKFANAFEQKFDEDSKFHWIALFLDPRTWNSSFMTESRKRKMQNVAKEEMSIILEEEGLSEMDPDLNTSVQSDDLSLPTSCPLDYIPRQVSENDEISDYYGHRHTPFRSLLDFWKSNSVLYPMLSRMAKKYLCCQASAAAIERRWSIASHIDQPRRNRLALSKLSAQTFLNCNKDLW